MLKMKEIGWSEIDLEKFGRERNYQNFLSALLTCVSVFHEGEMRADGRLYETHPKKVCQILIYYGIIDEDTLTAALLHDVLESIGVRCLESISNSHGKEVAGIVEKLTHFKGQGFDLYCSGILQDHRAVLVKLADRIHNLRNMAKRIGTNAFFTERRLRDQSLETIRHIIPLAQMAIALYPGESGVLSRMKKELEKDLRITSLFVG
jgi:(p)ppGpp synthase/HD superfamily hydrolase